MENKFVKWLLKLFKKIVIWVVFPLLIALIVLSVGVDIAEKKGWLFEEEHVEVVDLSNEEKSEKIIKLEDTIKKDIDKTFAYYLSYKKMPNILYAKDSVVLMSYPEDYFEKSIEGLKNEGRKTIFNEYKINFVGNEQLTTVQLENVYLEFIKELSALHENENTLLNHLNEKDTSLSKKELRSLKNDMISKHIHLTELYNEIVQTYHLWTNKTAYLPYYDETTLTIEEMKEKEETLSVGVASDISLTHYKNIYDQLKDIDFTEIELSLNQDLQEVDSNFIFPMSYEEYVKELKTLQSTFNENKKQWLKLLANDKTFMQKETTSLINSYESYLNNRVALMSEIYIYYKDGKESTEVYFELFEKEILLRDEKEELNLQITNFDKILTELQGGTLNDLDELNIEEEQSE